LELGAASVSSGFRALLGELMEGAPQADYMRLISPKK
jgi:hypothetical protein